MRAAAWASMQAGRLRRIAGPALAAAVVANPGAQAATAARYDRATLGQLDCPQAVERVAAGAKAGDAEAQFALGQMHEEGWCVVRDAALAARHWRAAADAGHLEALLSLALLVGRGEGATQDYAACGALLRRAGVRVGDAELRDTYSLGYAYTWLRSMQRELSWSRDLLASGAAGVAEVEFDIQRGTAQALDFRGKGSETIMPDGSRLDRSKVSVQQAVADAAVLARARIAAPDAKRLALARFRERMAIAPGMSYDSADFARRGALAALPRPATPRH